MDEKRKFRAVNNIPADSQVKLDNKQISWSSPDLVIKVLYSRNPINNYGNYMHPKSEESSQPTTATPKE